MARALEWRGGVRAKASVLSGTKGRERLSRRALIGMLVVEWPVVGGCAGTNCRESV